VGGWGRAGTASEPPALASEPAASTLALTNTGKTKYQFIAALDHTCGVCLQYHLKISAAWPISIHHDCCPAEQAWALSRG